jgi:hypothetical protein
VQTRSPSPSAIGVAGILRELIESVVEDSTKREPQQDLRPENQDSGFLQRDLDLIRQLQWRHPEVSFDR